MDKGTIFLGFEHVPKWENLMEAQIIIFLSNLFDGNDFLVPHLK